MLAIHNGLAQLHRHLRTPDFAHAKCLGFQKQSSGKVATGLNIEKAW
jgi:hypothetical protein